MPPVVLVAGAAEADSPDGSNYALELQPQASISTAFMTPTSGWTVSFYFMSSSGSATLTACAQTNGTPQTLTATDQWQQSPALATDPTGGILAVNFSGTAGQTLLVSNLQIGPLAINLQDWFDNPNGPISLWVAASAITSMAAASDGTLLAVDENGTLFRGQANPVWSAVPAPAPGLTPPQAVAAASDGTVLLLVGGVLQMYVAISNSWIPVPATLPNGTQLARIAAGSADAIWAIDTTGAVWSVALGAAAWTSVPGTLSAVSVGSDGTVYGVSSTGGVQLFDGSAFQSVQPQPPGTPSSVSVATSDWIWCVTSAGVYQTAGANQPWVPVVGSAASPIEQVFCGVDSSALGYGSEQIFRYDFSHTTWEPFTAPGSGQVASVAVVTQDHLWAIDSRGSVFQCTADTFTWSGRSISTGLLQVTAVSFQVVYGLAADSLWQMNGDGQGAPIPLPTGGAKSWLAAGTDGLWALDTGGNFYEYDTSQPTYWRLLGSTNPPLGQITATSSTNMYGLAQQGQLYRYVASGTPAWTAVAGAPALSAVSVSSDGAVWGVIAAGQSNAGQAWLGGDGMSLTAAGAFERIAAAAVNRVWAVDTQGHALTLMNGGDLFGDGHRPAAVKSSSVATASPRRVAAAGVGGVVPIGPAEWDVESVFDEQDSTHLWLVNASAAVAAKQGAVGSQIAALIKPPSPGTQSGAVFSRNLCQGIYDADFVTDYAGPTSWLHKTWAAHFYDPDSSQNYQGAQNWTALTQGRAFFWDALRHYAAGDMVKAGYHLGLALHYMTDITQPMHSSNYTYLSSSHWGYHSDFEAFVMQLQGSSSGYASTQSYPATPAGLDPGVRLINAARSSKPQLASLTRMGGPAAPAYPCQPFNANLYDPNNTSWHCWFTSSQWTSPLWPLFSAAVGFTSQFLVDWITLALSSSAICELALAATGRVIGVPGSNPTVGAQLGMFPWNNSAAQKIGMAAAATPGYWVITCLCKSQSKYNGWAWVLDGNAPPDSVGSPVVQGVYTGADSQLWSLSTDANGQYLTNKASGKVLTALFSPTANQMMLYQIQPVAGQSPYWLTGPNLASTMSLDSTHLAGVTNNSGSAGAGLQLGTVNTSNGAQKFLWVPLNGPDAGYFMVLTGGGWSGLALQDMGVNQPVQQNAWSPTADSMKWQKTATAGGVTIRNKSTGAYLTGSTSASSSPITTGTAATVWTVAPVLSGN